MVNLGGYFASLRLMTDEDSFRKGIGILEKFPTSLKTVGVGALGVAAGMVALATTTANAMTKLDAQAKTLGMNALTLDNWKNAVKLAGGDADSFVGSLMNMNEAFRNLQIGEVKEDFIKATGMSGADFGRLQGMNNDQRLRTIWSALERVADPSKQQALIQKIFGSAGVDLFSRLQLQGNTLGQMYNQAAAMNPNTLADYETALKGNELQNSIAVSFENTAKLVGIKIEDALLPALQDLSKWLKDNKASIAAFAEAVGQVTKFMVNIVGGGLRFMTGSDKDRLEMMLGGADKMAAFEALAKSKGLSTANPFDSSLLGLLMSRDWANVSQAQPLAGSSLLGGLMRQLEGTTASAGTLDAFRKYTSILEGTNLTPAEKLAREQKLVSSISAAPTIELTVNVDKSGNVTIGTTNGYVRQTIDSAIIKSNASEGLR